MKRFLLLSVISVVCLSASAQKKKEDMEMQLPSITVHYSLPKIVFKVDVDMQEIVKIPGKYSGYAEKYLGIKPEITEMKSEWSVKNISLTQESVPDNNRLYTFTSSNPDGTLQISLTEKGLLAGVGKTVSDCSDNDRKVSVTPFQEKEMKVADYKDIKTYNFLDYRVDSLFYEEKGPKNVVTRHFDPNSPGHYYTKEEKQIVRELVSRIYDIRTDRFDILRGDLELSDNVSLKDLMDNYDEMDEACMKLFLGTTVVRNHKATFYIEPADGKNAQLLFNFSSSRGITNEKDVAAQPYVLTYTDVIKPGKSSIIVTSEELAYIEPAYARAVLSVKNKEIASFNVVVPQWGVVNKMTVKGLQTMDYSFYPQYGSLKSATYKR